MSKIGKLKGAAEVAIDRQISMFEWIIEPQEKNMRLETVVHQRVPHHSRGAIRRLLAHRPAYILLDGSPTQKGQRVRPGSRLCVAEIALRSHPEPNFTIPLRAIGVHADYLVLDKAAGISMHPLTPYEDGTIANALAAKYPECADASAPLYREGGLVHRLDRWTSGVCIAARNPQAYQLFREYFSGGKVQKTYLALIHGRLEKQGEISHEIAADPGDRKRVLAYPEGSGRGLPARTTYQPIAANSRFTVVQAICRTGRRHQVRAHFAALGHPLIGDLSYGGSAICGAPGPLLHASRIIWPGGGSGYRAPLPSDRADFIARLLGCRQSVDPR